MYLYENFHEYFFIQMQFLVKDRKYIFLKLNNEYLELNIQFTIETNITQFLLIRFQICIQHRKLNKKHINSICTIYFQNFKIEN